MADDVLEKFAVGAKFHYHIIVVGVFEKVVKLDNTCVVKLLVDADFDFEALTEVLRVEACFGDNFAGKELMSLLVAGKLDD